MKPQPKTTRPTQMMGDDPLAGDAILERFYRPPQTANDVNDASNESTARPLKEKPEKPTHYKVVCISLYNEDIERLETMVAELKRRGHTKANKSQLIRAALAQVDLAKIPKGF